VDPDIRLMTSPLESELSTTVDWRRIEVVDDVTASIMRNQSPAQKILFASSLHRFMRMRIAGDIQTQHPDWSPEQISHALVERLRNGTA
jgi:hypothetical protein